MSPIGKTVPEHTLHPGDQVPHFEVTTISGRRVAYGQLWQLKNLVLVALPRATSAAADGYVSALAARAPEFERHEAACIVTRESIERFPGGVLVADRWGEIAHLAAASDVTDLPAPDELIEWLGYLQLRCPECEGEAR
jgi:hypothetical protein